jgi:hypothetical protein
MKRMNILMILAGVHLLGSSLLAQKEDFVWVLGYAYNEARPPHGIVNLKFDDNGDYPSMEYHPRIIDLDNSNASICDKDGNLLFFTNGNSVYTKNHTLMGNGSGIGHPDNPTSNFLVQGYIILPKPGSKHLYYIIYGDHEVITLPTGGSDGYMYNLKYSLIDMQRNGGYGKVVEKNKIIIEKKFSWGGITACRHANGRDWWIAIPGFHNSNIEIYLLNVFGLTHYRTQEFTPSALNIGGVPSTTFSPNGEYYAYAESDSIYGTKFIYLFEFDRCAGHYKYLETILEPESSVIFNTVFSPNSRLLYNVVDSTINQYDMYADSIGGSKITVAKYDGFVDWVKTLFDTPVLAPDDRIYVNAVSSSHYLHVIEKPDVRGVGCDVRQHSIKLPAYNCRTMPNFPHFRLGKLEGSPCDTLISSSTRGFGLGQINIRPNPATDYLVVGLPESVKGEVDVSLTSQQGVEVLRMTISGDEERIDVSGIPSGVYILTIRTQSGQTGQVKCVIQR